jgi:multisubunit Na+/H+ antiporter MnhC subunit
MPLGALSVSDVQCVSMAENTLQNIVIGFAVVSVTLALLVALHRFRVINLRAIFCCSADGQRFDSLKENPYADPLPRIVIDEKKDDKV